MNEYMLLQKFERARSKTKIKILRQALSLMSSSNTRSESRRIAEATADHYNVKIK